MRTKAQPFNRKSRIVRARRTIEELRDLLEALDPFIIRLAALGFLLLAIAKVLRAH